MRVMQYEGFLLKFAREIIWVDEYEILKLEFTEYDLEVF
jgi:hypothetical protein